jgi:hypothetical protein
VRVEGSSGHLHFECRIGHAYGLGSLLAGKEEMIEKRLWSAVVSCEEMVAVLEELQALGEPYTAGQAWTAATERIGRLRASAAAMRRVIDGNAAIDLGIDAGHERGSDQPC